MIASDPLQTLVRIGEAGDAPCDIAEGALALASLDRPQIGLERYRHHLASLARDVQDRVAARGGDRLSLCVEALAAVIAGQYGYRGDSDTYDDLQNANMTRVIDRRRGLPVALGILYIHAARAQGWRMVGLDFPGHFVVRLETAHGRAILDPFHGGAVRDAAQLREQLKKVAGAEAELSNRHYAEVSDRAVLIRLQNNVKSRLVRAGDLEGGARQIERLLRLAPENGALWLELGVLEARIENLGAAVAALRNCLDRSAEAAHRHQAAALLQQISPRLN